jgi:hypothetical protein
MILKLNIDKDDLLQVAKFRQYKPSSDDLTKEEMATELAIEVLKEQVEDAWLKEDRRAVTKRDITITSAP